MKLKYTFTTMDMDGELMAVPMDCDDDFRGILRMNGLTSDILKLLEQDTDEDCVVASLLKEYDATEEQIRASVQKVLGILRQEKLLSE